MAMPLTPDQVTFLKQTLVEMPLKDDAKKALLYLANKIVDLKHPLVLAFEASSKPDPLGAEVAAAAKFLNHPHSGFAEKLMQAGLTCRIQGIEHARVMSYESGQIEWGAVIAPRPIVFPATEAPKRPGMATSWSNALVDADFIHATAPVRADIRRGILPTPRRAVRGTMVPSLSIPLALPERASPGQAIVIQ